MSMLTPPGMGGEYRITGDKYPRMRRPRRRRRIVLAIVACTAVLGLLAYGTIELIGVFNGEKSGGKSDRNVAADKTPDCKPAAATPSASKTPAKAPKPMVLPEPKDVQVNVYNATNRGGLAGETADELKKRGFTVGKVGNAEKKFDGKVEGKAILLGPKSALKKGIVVLGTQVEGAEARTDAREVAAIDLILGDGFTSLATKAEAKQAIEALTNPAPPSPATPKGC
ncbi:LytR C-terminal domain-containing protein [Streptomyces sp. KLOTTS4A1]|uniref:LytR C-terminal domain-containing protein n=1 Tax=Streptomyces sp. KLOTTS4A1 TaxID=3390996 RepID=UPI0039F5EE68